MITPQQIDWFVKRNGYTPTKIWIDEYVYECLAASALKQVRFPAKPPILTLGGIPTFPR